MAKGKFFLKKRLRSTVLEVNSHYSCSAEGFQNVHLITSSQQIAELFSTPGLAELFSTPGSVLRAGDATVSKTRCHLCVTEEHSINQIITQTQGEFQTKSCYEGKEPGFMTGITVNV